MQVQPTYHEHCIDSQDSQKWNSEKKLNLILYNTGKSNQKTHTQTSSMTYLHLDCHKVWAFIFLSFCMEYFFSVLAEHSRPYIDFAILKRIADSEYSADIALKPNP